MSTYENFLMSAAYEMAASDEPEAFVMTAAETLAVTIEEFDATGKYKQGCYNKMHAAVSECADLVAAEALLTEGELLFIRNNFSEEQIAKESTKAGKIKTTKFLPNDYRSAKSVLLNALGNGIALFDENGEALGKSALSAAVSGSTKTDQQKLDEALLAVIKYAARIHEGATLAVRLWKDGDIIEERTN